MKWNKQLPKKPGFYWFSEYPGDIIIVSVEESGGKLWARGEGFNFPIIGKVEKDKDTFWCGPIPEPE